MTAVTEPPPRIATLDIVRGVAVMGILAMNIVAYSMPMPAYLNPMAYGFEGMADLASWVFSFILIDGKMRGLFSFLFGASLLLVIERAEGSGRSAKSVHFRRMGWLLLFGLLHFYLIWFGDILFHYAVIGMVAWLFRAKAPKALLRWGIGLVVVQFIVFAISAAGFEQMSAAATAPGASAEAVENWREMTADLAVPDAAEKAKDLALHKGSFSGIVEDKIENDLFSPLTMTFLLGWETLGYMILGMAALKSGFFLGLWPSGRYRKIALIGFGLGIPAYALLAYLLVQESFGVLALFYLSMLSTVLIRPLMIVATAALIILWTRRGGALVDRIAATGRAAFTNYLGTSILMAAFFYGYGAGMYGEFRRVELWAVVIAMWAVMLLWSKPWLDRYRYGPFEWLWRTLTHARLQPMKRGFAAA